MPGSSKISHLRERIGLHQCWYRQVRYLDFPTTFRGAPCPWQPVRSPQRSVPTEGMVSMALAAKPGSYLGLEQRVLRVSFEHAQESREIASVDGGLHTLLQRAGQPRLMLHVRDGFRQPGRAVINSLLLLVHCFTHLSWKRSRNIGTEKMSSIWISVSAAAPAGDARMIAISSFCCC